MPEIPGSCCLLKARVHFSFSEKKKIETAGDFCYLFLFFLSSFVFPFILSTFLLSFLPSFLCFSVCRYVWMYCVHMCALRPQVNSGIFLCCCPPYFMRAGLLLNVGLEDSVGLLPNVPHGSFLFCFPSTGDTDSQCHTRLLMGMLVIDSSSHAPMASTSPYQFVSGFIFH